MGCRTRIVGALMISAAGWLHAATVQAGNVNVGVSVGVPVPAPPVVVVAPRCRARRPRPSLSPPRLK